MTTDQQVSQENTEQESNNLENSPAQKSEPQKTAKKESPFEVQKSVEAKVSEKVGTDASDELLIEEEGGDFFWVLQRISWSLVKMLFVLGLIGFLVWIIWNPQDNPIKKPSSSGSQKEKPTEPRKPKERPTDEPKQPSKPDEPQVISGERHRKNESYYAALWHEQIEKNRLDVQKTIVSDSLKWLREYEALFDTPQQLVNQKEYEARKAQIEKLTQEMRTMLDKARQLQATLQEDINEMENTASEHKNRSDALYKNISSHIKTYEPVNTDELISQAIEAEKIYQENSIKVTTRKMLLDEIIQAQKYLSLFRESLIANKEVIARDLKVVEYPGDYFRPVISPAEWRQAQEER